MIGPIVDEFSRGRGHITTRQDFRLHSVQLERVPDVMRLLASTGPTTREACGETVRNVQGCHLAGACPYEVLDISGWAEATHQHLLRNPLAQPSAACIDRSAPASGRGPSGSGWRWRGVRGRG